MRQSFLFDYLSGSRTPVIASRINKSVIEIASINLVNFVSTRLLGRRDAHILATRFLLYYSKVRLLRLWTNKGSADTTALFPKYAQWSVT